MPGSATVGWAFGHWLRLIVRRWFLPQRPPDRAGNFVRLSVATDGTIPIRLNPAEHWAIIH
jgi:hypothetical protein